MGPWAKFKDEQVFEKQEVYETDYQKEMNSKHHELEEKQRKHIEKVEQLELLPVVENEDPEDAKVELSNAYSIFHAKSELINGRSYIEPPPGYHRHPEQKYYLPKKLYHIWSGHSKRVQKIKFFPEYGHYLFSCSYDGRVKLWDVLGN